MYIAEFNPKIKTDSGEVSRIQNQDKASLALESIILLDDKNLDEVQVKIEDSYWEPRMVTTPEGEPPYQAEKVKFLFKLYSKVEKIPLKLEGL